MKICLLSIDMQKSYIDPLRGKRNIKEVCEHINYVGDLLRNNGHLVVHIQDVEDVEILGEEQLEIISEIEISKKDLLVQKIKGNAFWSTELDTLLKDHEIELVISAGFAAEYCVLFTYNGAQERDYKSVMLQNGILSSKDDAVASSYRDRNIVSYPVIEYIVGE